jgi:hypothetical protein
MDPSDGYEPAFAARVVRPKDIPSTNFDVEIYAGIYVLIPYQVYLGW